jgi:hypothetical protein
MKKKNVSTFTNKIIDPGIRYIQFIVIMDYVTH